MAMRILAISILAMFCSVRPAAAWEADVHYGLVKWLAYQAGFSLNDAELIAAGSESADETHVLMATHLVVEACLRRKAPKTVAVSRVVQQHHFPASASVPGAPRDRSVAPGKYGRENAGNRWIRQEIDAQAGDIDRVVRLNRLGASLHPLADSWSHGGEPDVPARCRQPGLAWSHPEARGGWSSHDADLTHMHPKDTAETAMSVYRYLRDFIKAHPSAYRQYKPPVRWLAAGSLA